MTRTNEHKSVVPKRVVQASGRGTEWPGEDGCLQFLYFQAQRAKINQYV